MKVARQLFKEFCIPFIGAFAWVAINYSGDIKKSTTLFGGTFFFIAWLTGQIFRVKKQNATDESFSAIRADIATLLGDLKLKTDNLIGHVTGGRSICFFTQPYISEGKAYLLIESVGEYPTYDVSAGVVDIDHLRTRVEEIGVYEAYRTAPVRLPVIEVLTPGYAKLTDVQLTLEGAVKKIFTAHIKARNGMFFQRMQFVCVDGRWLFATVVQRAGEEEPCYKWAQLGFPVNKDGEVEWDM